MAKAEKTFLIECENSGGIFGRGNRPNSYYYSEGTLAELIKYHSYTLEVGASWQHEKGNKKIDRNPKTINSLIKNLNNAVNNSAANGYAGKDYRVVTQRREK
jgi:hypothetical protein